MGRQQKGTIERHLQVTCAPSKFGPKATAANEHGKQYENIISHHITKQFGLSIGNPVNICLPGQ